MTISSKTTLKRKVEKKRKAKTGKTEENNLSKKRTSNNTKKSKYQLKIRNAGNYATDNSETL